jgi:hypothetical protein
MQDQLFSHLNGWGSYKKPFTTKRNREAVKGRKRPGRKTTSYKTEPPNALSNTMSIMNQTETVRREPKIILFQFWFVVTYFGHKMGTNRIFLIPQSVVIQKRVRTSSFFEI